MFSLRNKHKYTAYHDKHKDHTYTLHANTAGDDYDDDETDSFLTENLADIPSDDPMHNEDDQVEVDERCSDDQTLSSSQPTDSNKNWPPIWPNSKKHKTGTSDSCKSSNSPSTPTQPQPAMPAAISGKKQNKPRYSSTANFPDPELDEADDEQLERLQMKNIDNMRKLQEEEEAKFRQMIEEKKSALKKKNNFVSKLMNVFKRKQKTNKEKKSGQSKKKGKYNSPGLVDGEQCETPLTLTDGEEYSDRDDRE